MTETKRTTNLEELKAKLYEAFDRAVNKVNDSFERGSYEYGAKLLDTAAEAAKALAAVERELREAKERGYNKLDKN